MEYKKEIHNYIQSHRNEIVNGLMDLVKIPSENGNAEKKAPFGRICANILKAIQGLYEGNGFETEIEEDGGYLLSSYGNGDKSIGLFAHADVVAGGEDWIYTTPFEPIEKDGFLIGRGVLDDKSAVIASLYILKMFKDLKLPLKSKLVCYTGSNEESGMQDVKNYIAKRTPPDFSLVLDTAFPLYYGNKGVVRCMVTSNVALSGLNDFCGGQSTNVTLGKATAKIPYSESVYKELCAKETDRVKVSIDNGEIVLSAEGISKHGALPEGSLNAGFLIAEILSGCSFLNESDKKQMSFLAKILPDIYGETIGINEEDTDFGKPTCSNGVVKLESGKVSFSLDIRFGQSIQLETLKERLSKELLKKGFSVEFLRNSPVRLTAKTNPFIQTCLQTYRTFTGEENAQPRINAGGTYAMYLPCSAEIGTTTWRHACPFELPQGHGAVHQPDECICVDDFLEAIEIATLMVLACNKVDGKV